jgi:putative peptidase family protein
VKGIYGGLHSGSHDTVIIHTSDASGNSVFPDQSWPVVDGKIKVLVMLSPGLNRLVFQRQSSEVEININHVPLLQCQPLHLAIMVASDSPLLIDCPPGKHGGK